MKLADALRTLSHELIESPRRCRYPYVLTFGPCALSQTRDPEPGVFAVLDSELFGRIAGTSGHGMEEALVELAHEMIRTRQERWKRESSLTGHS